MKKIKLGGLKSEVQGYALVDDTKFDELSKYHWFLSWNGYAVSSVYVDRKETRIRMHKIVKDGRFIDHIDGNKLNNQLSNLRICSKSTNGMNRGKTTLNKSGYKGVQWNKNCQKWRAMIRINSKSHHIGVFDEIRDAVIAYNNKAKELFGEFAFINELPKS